MKISIELSETETQAIAAIATMPHESERAKLDALVEVVRAALPMLGPLLQPRKPNGLGAPEPAALGQADTPGEPGLAD